MADELPEDLQDLLNQLDEPQFPDDDLEPSNNGNGTFHSDDDLDHLEDVSSNISDNAVLRPVDYRRLENTNFDTEQTAVEGSIIDIAEYRFQLRTVTTEVLDACRSDRQEAQDVITMLQSHIANCGAIPPKALVDGLVKAVEVKANINQNAIRMMEANAKFISAARPAMNIKQNNFQMNSSDLDDLLNTPSDDFE